MYATAYFIAPNYNFFIPKCNVHQPSLFLRFGSHPLFNKISAINYDKAISFYQFMNSKCKGVLPSESNESTSAFNLIIYLPDMTDPL